MVNGFDHSTFSFIFGGYADRAVTGALTSGCEIGATRCKNSANVCPTSMHVRMAVFGLVSQNLQCTDGEMKGRKVGCCAWGLGRNTEIWQSCLALDLRRREPLCSSCGRANGRRIEDQGFWNGSPDTLLLSCVLYS